MPKTKNILKTKMRQSWSDLSDFMRTSGVPVSMETVRRAINEGKPVSIPSLLLITKYLGFEIPEIKQILIEAGDTDFSALIVDQTGERLTAREKALIDIYRKLNSKNSLADHLALLAKADGINVSKEITRLKRKGGK